MSIDLLAYDEDEAVPEELVNVGSMNHSYIQAELAYRLRSAGEYTIFTELSLDTAALEDEQLCQWFKGEIKPDVAVYPKRPINFHDDILRMSDMPLLAVEILSPMQGTLRLLRKVRAYFALGVQSCWIVNPLMQSITVYRSPIESTIFGSPTVLEDTVLGLSIPLTEIFG